MLRLGVPELQDTPIVSGPTCGMPLPTQDAPNAKDTSVLLEGGELDPCAEAESVDERLLAKVKVHAICPQPQ